MSTVFMAMIGVVLWVTGAPMAGTVALIIAIGDYTMGYPDV